MPIDNRPSRGDFLRVVKKIVHGVLRKESEHGHFHVDLDNTLVLFFLLMSREESGIRFVLRRATGRMLSRTQSLEFIVPDRQDWEGADDFGDRLCRVAVSFCDETVGNHYWRSSEMTERLSTRLIEDGRLRHEMSVLTQQLRTMVEFSPGGAGAMAAKSDFETRK